jgi:hypothetical protein
MAETTDNVESVGSQTEENTQTAENQQVESVEQVEQNEPVVEPVAETPKKPYDPDEYILDAFWNNGKKEVSTTDLISSGFDRSRIHTNNIEVGDYRLHRISTLAPYKLEKTA